MRRNVLTCAGGALLSLALLYGGAWVTYALFFRGGDEVKVKDDLIAVFLARELVIYPFVAVAVGFFVGLFSRGNGWWLAVVSFAPSLLLVLRGGPLDRVDVVFNCIYLSLNLAAALAASMLRNRRRVPTRGHV